MRSKRNAIWILGDWHAPHWVGSATTSQLKLLLHALHERGLSAMVVECPRTWSRTRRFIRRCSIVQEDGVPILSAGMLPLLWNLLRHRPPVVHFFAARMWMIPIMCAALLRGLKLVYTVHDCLFLLFPHAETGTRRLLRRLLCRSAHALVSPNEADAMLLRKSFPHATLYLVPNGIDSDCAAAPVVPNSSTILFAGGLGFPHKGLSFLEESLARLDCPHTLTVCGANPHGLTHPNYLGELQPEEYSRLLRGSRVVVVTSLYESFSMTALEAISGGIPVIITQQTGISRWLADGEGCIKVEYGDVTALTSRLEQLMTSDESCAALLSRGKGVAERFSAEALATRMLAVYGEHGQASAQTDEQRGACAGEASSIDRTSLDRALNDVLRSWQTKGSNGILRRALMLHVQPDVCRWLRAKHFGEAVKPSRSQRRTSAGVLWYILWTLKWMILRPEHRRRPVILTSLNQERIHARQAFAEIVEWSSSVECDVWQSTPIATTRGFFTRHVFCIPLRFIRRRSTSDGARYQQTWDDLSRQLRDRFNLSYVGGTANDPCGLYLEIERVYARLIRRLKDMQRLGALVQDSEYGAQQSVLTDLVNSLDRPTIAMQHGIQTEPLLWVPLRSQFYCIWGEQERERLVHAGATAASLHTIRHTTQYSMVKRHGRADLIVCLTNYDMPLTDTMTRSREKTRCALHEFSTEWRKTGTKMVVRPHPLDDPSWWTSDAWYISTGSLHNDLQTARVVIVEETTAIVNAVTSGVPVIFLANASGEDVYRLETHRLGVVHRWDDSASESLNRAVEMAPDEALRAEWLRWLNTPETEAEFSLTNLLANVLSTHDQRGVKQ